MGKARIIESNISINQLSRDFLSTLHDDLITLRETREIGLTRINKINDLCRHIRNALADRNDETALASLRR